MPLAKIETRYSIDPAVTDDVSKGYSDSWFWENQSTGSVFKCMDNTTGAAVWIRIANDATKVDKAMIDHILVYADDFLDGETNSASAYRLLPSVGGGSTGNAIVRSFGGSAGAVASSVRINVPLPSDITGTTIRYRVGGFVSDVALAANGGIQFSLAGTALKQKQLLSKALGLAKTSSLLADAEYPTYGRWITDWSLPVPIADLAGAAYMKTNMNRVTTGGSYVYAKPIDVSCVEFEITRLLVNAGA